MRRMIIMMSRCVRCVLCMMSRFVVPITDSTSTTWMPTFPTAQTTPSLHRRIKLTSPVGTARCVWDDKNKHIHTCVDVLSCLTRAHVHMLSLCTCLKYPRPCVCHNSMLSAHSTVLSAADPHQQFRKHCLPCRRRFWLAGGFQLTAV